MPSIKNALAGAILVATGANAHFNMKYPEPIGFEESRQDTGPCGGITPDFTKNTVTDFHVGGDAIAIVLSHPQANWLFRATLDQTGASNWTQAFPIVQQSGLGAFCEPAVAVPASFVGKKGIIGAVANAPDGTLFSVCAISSFSHTNWRE
jgi:hypothetical protein